MKLLPCNAHVPVFVSVGFAFQRSEVVHLFGVLAAMYGFPTGKVERA